MPAIVAMVVVVLGEESGSRGFLWPLVGSLAISFVVGLVDDLRPLRPLPKFLGQCLSAACLATAVGQSGLGGEAVVLAILVSLWSQNAWNFVDGSDGLMASAGIAIFLAGAVLGGVAGFERGGPILFPLLIAAALIGFLPWNLPVARLFLGDSGSLLAGSTYAACTVWAFLTDPRLGWAWVALAAPIHADVLVCLVRRLVRGCRWWEGHREHAYQHLAVRRGSHAAPLLAMGAMWIAIALPASLGTLVAGWLAPVAAIAVCSGACALLGSGRPVAPTPLPVRPSRSAEPRRTKPSRAFAQVRPGLHSAGDDRVLGAPLASPSLRE